jgi:hypothetical protein
MQELIFEYMKKKRARYNYGKSSFPLPPSESY